jgi:hypothetical protein
VTEKPSRRRALRSFVFGSVVGGAVAVGAQRLRRGGRHGHDGRGPESIAGLDAFEGAPCWEHDRRRSDSTPV